MWLSIKNHSSCSCRFCSLPRIFFYDFHIILRPIFEVTAKKMYLCALFTAK